MADIQKSTSVKSLLSTDNVKVKFQEILKDRAAGFTANLAVMVNNSAALSKCEPLSVISAAVVSASLDLPLDPNLGFAAIVPFNSKDGQPKAQFQIQYKGYKQLAIRSGQFEFIDWCRTYDSDTEEEILNRLKSIRKTSKDEKVTGYANYFRLLNGFESFYHMNVSEIEKHGKKYSQTYKKGYGLWVDDFDKMAKKTVIKLHLTNGDAPMSIEMQKAVKFDQSTIKDVETGEVEYIDNEAEKPTFENPEARKIENELPLK